MGRTLDDTDLEAIEQDIHANFNRTRGRLAGLIESWGLNERQERGAIATMKSLTYDAEAAIIERITQ